MVPACAAGSYDPAWFEVGVTLEEAAYFTAQKDGKPVRPEGDRAPVRVCPGLFRGAGGGVPGREVRLHRQEREVGRAHPV